MTALPGMDMEEKMEGTPQELVEAILRKAVEAGISDIHIEPMDGCVRVRLRRDGVLFPLEELPLDQLDKVIARLKIMSSLDIANKRLPQDGRFAWQNGERRVDMRVSTMPTVRGEKMVIRILDSGKVNLELDKLGMPLLAAMDDAVAVVPLCWFRHEMEQIKRDIESGQPFSVALECSACSTAYLVTMLVVGESTGNYEDILLAVKQYYEWHLGILAKRLKRLLEPCVLLVVGTAIGILVICLLLPMFDAAASMTLRN